jgi:hypothetical protein
MLTVNRGAANCVPAWLARQSPLLSHRTNHEPRGSREVSRVPRQPQIVLRRPYERAKLVATRLPKRTDDFSKGF